MARRVGSETASPLIAGAAALGAFLRTRRERLTPDLVGMAAVGRRRAPGLRREEVAALAGISSAWYTHLEQGRETRPSHEVLDAIAVALRLTTSERGYLFQLAGCATTSARNRGRRPVQGDRAERSASSATAPVSGPVGRDQAAAIRRLLDALGPIPAAVIDRCWDVVGRNVALGAMLPLPGPDLDRSGADCTPQNAVVYLLTSKAWRAVVPSWARVARLAVDGLRASMAGLLAEHPGDPRADALIRMLERASPEFRAWWPEHGVWAADVSVVGAYEHPHVGRIEWEVTLLDIRIAPGLTLVTCIPYDPVSAARWATLRDLIVEPQSGRAVVQSVLG